MTTQEKQKLGFIGLGHLGSGMVQRLLQAGYPVTVYDRTRAKAEELAGEGATIANSPRELARDNHVILSCVTNYQALTELLLGPEGALTGATKETHFIDCSTISPQESIHLAKEIEQTGCCMLDASVSGSVPQVKEGNLFFFVGGDRAIFEQSKPIMEVLGKNIFYMGENGKGATMKMVVNAILGLEFQAISEAVTLGLKAGLDKQQLLYVLGQTTVIAPAHKAKLENIRKEEYPTAFGLSLMRKDLGLIMHMAAELNVPMPATAAAEQMYAAALAQDKDEDFSSIYQFMAQIAAINNTQNSSSGD
jgi:3-hydroxyisobutyrate dehydrogenase-like beta-hydroxyacid dehydrogenase